MDDNNQIETQISQLIDLQKETSSASWSLTFSEKSNKYNLYLSNSGKKFSDANLSNALQKAISFILDKRKPNKFEKKFTLTSC